MLNRISLFVPALSVALLTSLLTACDSRTASESGAPPFVPPAGATDPSALRSGSTAVEKKPGTSAGALLPDSLHLISPGQAGRLRLGMREAQIKKLISPALLRATTYNDQGTLRPAYEMRDAQQPNAPASILHLIGDSATGYRLRRIRLYDPQYRTAEGIGVGSPFGAARQNLGLTKVRNTPAGFAAVSGEVKIAWVIDPNSLPDKHPEEMSSADIPPAARITGVLLYQ
ncbi:hypothetical protein KBK19_17910 [Microvirga sp. STR05]|uniref:Uncharacterized protein n=1 Tax=Hymenobacter duratus TaxID=2771356 RepID=A0ABR8JJA5_9BACT|nr:hypothetical protein [Hymenobacter duratus]MBD2716925.1 hypothetical protein [Hymenobacter duratus]MBR7951841.1 hypothetical protein [Microvirga sp. STR05]